jgi:hypothetical protein
MEGYCLKEMGREKEEEEEEGFKLVLLCRRFPETKGDSNERKVVGGEDT